MNIGMLLDMAADGMGDRPAVGSTGATTSYAELRQRAQRLGRRVAGSGAERLTFVGLNGDTVPVLLYGSAAACVPFAPLNYRLADERLRAVLARTAPSVVVADAGMEARVAGIEGVDAVAIDQLADRTGAGSEAAPQAATAPADPDDVAIWLFTSGTSGEPKAAMLRHRHLTSYVLSTVEFMAAAPDEANLVSVPPYHIAGMATILSSTYAGRRIVYLPRFDPAEWVRLADEEAVTHAMVVPTMLGRILDALKARGGALPALRHLSYGGGRMPLPVIERAMDMLPHVDFVNAYGLTETSSTIAVLLPDDHRVARVSHDPAVRARLGSVGRALPSVELEIRDADGAALPPGAIGEICVRGDQIAGEYHGGSTLTTDGWFPTNDGGYLDDAGFLFVEGRLDDVIVRGGENLSPGEIEDALLAHPGVADAAVTGVPDVEWGEVVAAAVVLEPAASVSGDELRAWVSGRLRSSRAPAVIEFREQLPYSDTGKLLRRVLKQELSARL